MAYDTAVLFDNGAKTTNIPKINNVILPLAITMMGDLRGWYQTQAQVKLLDMSRAAAAYPNGITIVSWYVDCSVVPTTQLTGVLKYCDVGGTFPGANIVSIDTITSTAGHSSRTDMSGSMLGSGVIPAGKIVYLDITADPTDYNTLWSLVVNFTLP